MKARMDDMLQQADMMDEQDRADEAHVRITEEDHRHYAPHVQL